MPPVGPRTPTSVDTRPLWSHSQPNLYLDCSSNANNGLTVTCSMICMRMQHMVLRLIRCKIYSFSQRTAQLAHGISHPHLIHLGYLSLAHSLDPHQHLYNTAYSTRPTQSYPLIGFSSTSLRPQPLVKILDFSKTPSPRNPRGQNVS